MGHTRNKCMYAITERQGSNGYTGGTAGGSSDFLGGGGLMSKLPFLYDFETYNTTSASTGQRVVLPGSTL